jgi:hypothetical protein
LAKDLATVLFPAPEGPSIAMVSFFLLKVFAIPTPQKGRNGLPRLERLATWNRDNRKGPTLSNGVYHIRKEFSRKEGRRDL